MDGGGIECGRIKKGAMLGEEESEVAETVAASANRIGRESGDNSVIDVLKVRRTTGRDGIRR
jgi:hypothetical protein